MTHDDVPGIRLWGDSRLAKGEAVALPDTATKPHEATPLGALSRGPVLPTRTSEDAVEPMRAPHQLAMRLVTDDGAPIELELGITLAGETNERSARTDPDGTLTMDAPEGSHSIGLPVDEEPLPLPPPPLVPQEPKGAVLLTRWHTGFSLSAVPQGAEPKLVVVARPRATEYVLDGWAQGSKVLRWGGASERIGADGLPRVGTARAWLRQALWAGKMREVVAVGHADPLGQDTDNEALALERARSVFLYASGDLDGFAEHAAAHGTELDMDCALVAVSRIVGDPVALGDDAGLESTFSRLAKRAGQPLTTPTERWRAIADVYDDDLTRIMGLDLTGLASLRSLVTWAGFVSVGERHPRGEVELVSAGKVPDARAHRRVSLLVMPAGLDGAHRIADGHADEIYDGTFRRTTIEAAAEAPVRIHVLDGKLEPIPAGRAWVQLGAIGIRELVADASGQICFTTLEGDRVAVVCAVDDRRGGTLVDGGRGAP